MHSPKKFLINFSSATDVIQALSMPFIAEKYDYPNKELFFTKEQYQGFLESLPNYFNQVEDYFNINNVEDFLILHPKQRFTKIVTVIKNLYTAIILNQTNFFLAPIDNMTAPMYTKDDEVIYPAYVEAKPTEILDVNDKKFTVFQVRLNHTEMYAKNIPYFDLTNPIYKLERLDGDHPFHVRVLEHGKEFQDAVARQAVVKSSHTSIKLLWFARANEEQYMTKLY